MRCPMKIFEGQTVSLKRPKHRSAHGSPEAQARVGHEEDLFTFHLVVAVVQLLGVVLFRHALEISVVESCSAYFFAAEAARAVRNGEASFGGSVDEVGGGTEIVGKFLVILDCPEGGGRAAISMLPDQPINRRIFPEALYSRSEDNELGAVGQRHASSIDRFVAQPRTLQFFRVQVDHRLSNGGLEHEKIDFETELRSFLKTLIIVAYEKSPDCEAPFFAYPHDRQDIHNGQVLNEMTRSIVQDSPNRIVRPPHDSFHAVYSAEEMAPVDTVGSAGANKNILVIIRHSDHFMGNNLSDGEHQIESAFDQHPVDLNRPGIVELAFRLFVHILGRHFPQCDSILSPVVCVKQIERYAAKHLGDLARRHGSVRAKCRQYRTEPFSVKFI